MTDKTAFAVPHWRWNSDVPHPLRRRFHPATNPPAWCTSRSWITSFPRSRHQRNINEDGDRDHPTSENLSFSNESIVHFLMCGQCTKSSKLVRSRTESIPVVSQYQYHCSYPLVNSRPSALVPYQPFQPSVEQRATLIKSLPPNKAPSQKSLSKSLRSCI